MGISVKDKGNRIILSGAPDGTELVKEGPIVIHAIHWLDPTAENNAVTLVDADGDIEIHLEAKTAGQQIFVEFPLGHATMGQLYCTSLTSSTAIIYYKSHV